jgi:rare lipoprotein A
MSVWALRAVLLGAVAATLAACAGGPRPQTGIGAGGAPTSRYAGYKVGKPYQVNGVWYYPKAQPNYDEIGIASWYGEQFHNHYTADGEVFDMNMPSAAHKTLPLPSLVEVTNLANGRTVVVRVNDRGPFVSGRVIDLSRAAATELGFTAAGVTRVRVRYVGQAPDPPLRGLPSRDPAQPRQYLASAPVQSTPATAAPAPAAGPVQLARNTAPDPVVATSVSSAPPIAAPVAAAQAPVAPPQTPPQASDEVDSLLGAAPASPAPAPVSAPPPMVVAQTGGAYEVQAGVFASQANAQRIAAGLSGSGSAEVQPFARGGQTFYRVVVRGFANAGDAAAARGQAAALGVVDARVVAAGGA